MNNHYQRLAELSKRATLFEGMGGLLGWDQETYMPSKAAPIRAEQKELLAELAHRTITDGEFEKNLRALIDLESGQILMKNATEDQKAVLHVYRHDFLRLKKLPTAFVQEFTKTTSEAIFIWDKAKRENDYASFEPSLKKIVELNKQKANYIGYTDHPYDALLDEFEPECRTKDVDLLFKELSGKIPLLLQELLALQEENPITIKPLELASDEQLVVCRKVLDSINYDFTRGRLDLSSHPFSSSYHPYDCRITTRIESHGIENQVLTTLHEAGHSFYEMGLPVEAFGTPLGRAASLGIHESESRCWETRIGRTLAFWQFLLPEIQKLFPNKDITIPPEQFFRMMSTVSPTLIRTDSDEVTYPLHVILRFQIEKEFMEGKLTTKDLPERWRVGMKTLLGIEPKTNAQGCLQDIHWSMGAFGYFPTYTLGNIFAAELFEVFVKEFPDWQERIKRGDFEFIRSWHEKNIHREGRRYTSNQLVEKITKRPVSAKSYIQYLSDKYKTIFSKSYAYA